MPTIEHILAHHARDLYKRLEESEQKRIYRLSLPHFALLLVLSDTPFVAIEDSAEAASLLYHDLLFFRDLLSVRQVKKAAHFPPPVNEEAVGERALALMRVSAQRDMGMITSVDGCKTGFRLSGIEDVIFTLSKSVPVGRDGLEAGLSRLGYRNVSVVVEQGEYSRREWLFDIYPTTADFPVRVEFFGDEIELMRTFEIETQRSVAEIHEITLAPAQEGPLSGDLIQELAGEGDMTVFWAAAPDKTVPEEAATQGLPFVTVSHLPFIGEGADAGSLSLRGLGVVAEERKSLNELASALKGIQKPVMVVLPSHAQAERLREVLFDSGLIAPVMDKGHAATYEGNLCIIVGSISEGVHLPGVLILTDREIFGERPAYRPIRKSRVSKLLLTIDDLKPGDFVVHKDHGIGRFVGLLRQRTDSREEDLITIEYAEAARLHIPFQGIDRLQKYSAAEGHMPALDRLGGKTWQRRKQGVSKGIREMAERLLRLYAERKASRGFVFSEDTPLHVEFDGFFPYEETPDQLRAVEEIKKHMHSETPMDMLLCGDVGYGKTEVAMRAAFRAVYDGTQVAVLVPTTLLAEQHFRTFRTRFSGFPVTIEYLSRFRNKEDTVRCLAALAKGEVDIIIGTHMLLNRKVQFSDLGLLIIDEEHRFGVAQKERLKELKKGVDVLTLTATPIPRTLHMSLSGIREICTIETPPEERLAVKSFVTVFNDRTIQEAITREQKRGGQTFFVHNRIYDIDKMAAHLSRLLPETRIAIAHGQMREGELEKIMLRFLDKKTEVLVCTSIIGSGLDIPTANTLIVDRADTFGLSDLYQLRGRVGRGTVQAYAYFLIAGEDIMTDEAKKRLQAIQEMSYLGAGFRLALRDLDIRGAGNLLGSEQSGHIYKVGLEMYMEMLEKTVAELKGEEITEEVEPQIRLPLSAFVPEHYITDVTLRLSFYKRLSSVTSMEVLSDLRDEMMDRFGVIPEETNNLMHVIKLKLLAKQLFIEKVHCLNGRYRFFFVSDPEDRFKIPQDFFDRTLKFLFMLADGAGKAASGRIKFFPEGFELDTGGMSTEDAVTRAEELLRGLVKSLHAP